MAISCSFIYSSLSTFRGQIKWPSCRIFIQSLYYIISIYVQIPTLINFTITNVNLVGYVSTPLIITMLDQYWQHNANNALLIIKPLWIVDGGNRRQ